jgi:hypothetical protein
MKPIIPALNVALAVAFGAVALLLWRHWSLPHSKVAVEVEGPANPERPDGARVKEGLVPGGVPTERPPTDVVATAESTAADSRAPAPRSPATSPYEIALEQFREEQPGGSFRKSLTQAHERIMNAQDDPAWTRAMERQLADFIYGQPEAAGLEISSIVCRSIGCEIQILGAIDDAKPVSPRSVPGWQAIVARLRVAHLSPHLEVGHTFVIRAFDRTAYITALNRRSGD